MSICDTVTSLPALIALSFTIQFGIYGAIGTFDGRMDLGKQLACYLIDLVLFFLTMIAALWVISYGFLHMATTGQEAWFIVAINIYRATFGAIDRLERTVEAMGSRIHTFAVDAAASFRGLRVALDQVTGYIHDNIIASFMGFWCPAPDFDPDPAPALDVENAMHANDPPAEDSQQQRDRRQFDVDIGELDNQLKILRDFRTRMARDWEITWWVQFIITLLTIVLAVLKGQQR